MPASTSACCPTAARGYTHDTAKRRQPPTVSADTASWGAVLALTLCVATLIASEFMPVSLLTPIASDLHLTEGQAGQAIAISGIFAVLTSLFIAAATRRLDRRTLLLWLTALMLVSGMSPRFAPNYAVLMAGRALRRRRDRRLLVDVGGDSHAPRAGLRTCRVASRSSTAAMRWQQRSRRRSAVSLDSISAGAAPSSAWCRSPRSPLCGSSQRCRPCPAGRVRTALAAFQVLRRPGVPLGMAAVALFFMGQFALFTYLRPFLETVTRVNVSTLIASAAGHGRRRPARHPPDRLGPANAPLPSADRHACCDGGARDWPGRIRHRRSVPRPGCWRFGA